MSLQAFRAELAHPRISLQLCALGSLGGACAAGVIILFRLGYEWIQSLYLSQSDDFTSAAPEIRLILPVLGAICILLFAYISGFKHSRMGVPFVIHRVKTRYGHIPWKPTFNQFFGGMFALASGFSVGREGPSVHLGAAGSGLFGQWLKLPYNSIRIMAGCGVAAGISASFNTPFAAVIFVMEVVLREYRIHVFIPIMLAAAVGSMLTRMVFGREHELDFLQFVTLDTWMYLYLVLMGIVLGLLASVFNDVLMATLKRVKPIRMSIRLMCAAVLTGLVGYLVPQAMGGGLVAIQELLTSNPSVSLLLLVLVVKILMTWVAIGLGVPGGLMGPVIVIGIIAGAFLMLPLQWLGISGDEYTSSFALLGMAGLLTSVLHAPLAALSAVMELSNAPEVILPAMLIIAPAYVMSNQFMGNRSIFIRQLDFQKLRYANSSVKEALQAIGALSVMDTEFRVFDDDEEKQMQRFIASAPTHPVVQRSTFEVGVNYSLVEYDVSLDPHAEKPLRTQPMQGLVCQATLAEIYDLLQASRDGAVYIYDNNPEEILGVITWNMLRSYLIKEQY